MRKIKSGFGGTKEPHGIVVLQNIPHHHGLIKANRFLLLVASTLMVIVFVLGFFLLPAGNMLDDFTVKHEVVPASYAVQNPVISAEINALKGQLVGLVSGSIESKLRTLEESIRMGKVNSSLGTIQDLKNDVKVLQSYSVPEKTSAQGQMSQAVIKEISQLKNLIYLTLTSCGLMIAAIGGIWVRNRYRLSDYGHTPKAELGKGE
ncbi:MAG: hypothetical protein KAQ91_05840 [Methylococcales bacterium]|nr:hypothetical protein [Methylococcales bacterium]